VQRFPQPLKILVLAFDVAFDEATANSIPDLVDAAKPKDATDYFDLRLFDCKGERRDVLIYVWSELNALHFALKLPFASGVLLVSHRFEFTLSLKQRLREIL